MTEKDQVLGHGDEADGIEEYDNKLPAWWLGLFYGCIVFGIAYAVNYHFLSDDSQTGRYEAELAAAAERWPQPEAGEVLAVTEESIAAGKEIYAANCLGCHGPSLEGGIGPNLKDSEWIHGGTLEQIAETISKGVPEKGMLTWGPILGPQKIGQVTAFIHSQGGGT